MSILNRPSDGLPSVLLALYRTLIAYGPQKDDRIIELCAPKTAALSDAEMARKTLTRWKQLGFFQPDGEVLKLTPLVKKIAPDDLDRLRTVLLKLVLAPENNPALATTQRETDEDEKVENTRAADFTAAASWALAQEPYNFPTAFPAAERLVSAQRMSLKLFANSTRWNGFLEWGTFLGLGIQSGKAGLIPNPFFAVTGVLDEVFQGASELPQSLFLSRLADCLPIIDGGGYRQMIDIATAQPAHTLRPHQVSPCLSAALQTLAEKQVLRLEPRSDAPQRVLLGRDRRERAYSFSHVVRLEVA